MNSFIKSLMEERKLKQKELAGILGISPSAVSQWNEDGTNITTGNLFSLSKLFHVTVDELLEGKRTGESLEDKWRREYDINKEIATKAMMAHNKELLLQCLNTVAKTNNRFFVLFERKIIGKISETELKEWQFIKRYYKINIRKSHLFDEITQLPTEDKDNFILNHLKKICGTENKDAILWEIKKIYKIEDFGIDDSILSDFDNDLFYNIGIHGDLLYYDAKLFYAWYNILTPREKDIIINDEFNYYKDKEMGNIGPRINLYELIKRGGNILYTRDDLNITNYDYNDLKELEGEIKPVPALNKAQAAIYDISDGYSLATYEQYQSLINFPRMKQIEMEVKYKEKNPIKYWEYIKSNELVLNK